MRHISDEVFEGEPCCGVANSIPTTLVVSSCIWEKKGLATLRASPTLLLRLASLNLLRDIGIILRTVPILPNEICKIL